MTYPTNSAPRKINAMLHEQGLAADRSRVSP